MLIYLYKDLLGIEQGVREGGETLVCSQSHLYIRCIRRDILTNLYVTENLHINYIHFIKWSESGIESYWTALVRCGGRSRARP